MVSEGKRNYRKMKAKEKRNKIYSEHAKQKWLLNLFLIFVRVEFNMAYNLNVILKFDIINRLCEEYTGKPVNIERMVIIWKEKKSWILFSPKTMKFRMVAQVRQNIITVESFQKVSNDLAWVNEVCCRLSSKIRLPDLSVFKIPYGK